MRVVILLAAIVLAAAALWLFVEQPEYDSPAVDVSKASSDAVAADEWDDGNADPADRRLVQPDSAKPIPETNSAAQLDFGTGPDANPLTHPGAYVMSMVDSARAGDTSAQRSVARAAKYCEGVQQLMQMAEAPWRRRHWPINSTGWTLWIVWRLNVACSGSQSGSRTQLSWQKLMNGVERIDHRSRKNC